MLFTFTVRSRHAYRSKDRLVRKTSLDRADDLGLLGLVALVPRHPRFHNREWTNGLLESQRHEPLAGQDGPRAL